MITRLIIAVCLVASCNAIPIDNGVEGDPEIECGPTSITINFNTQNNFEGHVYVKGLYDQPECRKSEGGRQVAGIELPFESCNVARTRSLNPKGVFVSTTVVITFHPQFITKIDRAYKIQCFYMEADKTVSAELEVSMLTTGFQTQLVPMPICRYEILEGGPTGSPVQFALVGDQVYHKWTCDTETVDTFCMIVHSCFVDDGNGERVDLLNQDGCAIDKFLLNNLEYPTDLMAGQEAHVFKYADRPQLFFQCQITITVKEPNEECPRPTCSEPQGFASSAGGPTAAGVRTLARQQTSRVVAPVRPPPPAPVAPVVAPAPAPITEGFEDETAGTTEGVDDGSFGGRVDRAPAAGAFSGVQNINSREAIAVPGPGDRPPAISTDDFATEDPFGFAKRFRLLRKKRSAPRWEIDNAGVMDVRAEVSTLDIEDSPRRVRTPTNSVQSVTEESRWTGRALQSEPSTQGLCFSFMGFSAVIAIGISLIVAITVVGCSIHSSTPKK